MSRYDKRIGTEDGITNAIKVMTQPHHEIHEGRSFTCHYSITTAATDGHRTVIGFKTPDTNTWGHLTMTVTANNPADVDFLEAPTIDLDAGSDLTIFNRNRNSSQTSLMLSVENPAVAGGATSYTEAQIAAANFSGGTELAHLLLAGGRGPRTVGGTSRAVQEWLLKQNTLYIFLLSNVGANANTHVIDLSWYEHANIS